MQINFYYLQTRWSYFWFCVHAKVCVASKTCFCITLYCMQKPAIQNTSLDSRTCHHARITRSLTQTRLDCALGGDNCPSRYYISLFLNKNREFSVNMARKGNLLGRSRTVQTSLRMPGVSPKARSFTVRLHCLEANFIFILN